MAALDEALAALLEDVSDEDTKKAIERERDEAVKAAKESKEHAEKARVAVTNARRAVRAE